MHMATVCKVHLQAFYSLCTVQAMEALWTSLRATVLALYFRLNTSSVTIFPASSAFCVTCQSCWDKRHVGEASCNSKNDPLIQSHCAARPYCQFVPHCYTAEEGRLHLLGFVWCCRLRGGTVAKVSVVGEGTTLVRVGWKDVALHWVQLGLGAGDYA